MHKDAVKYVHPKHGVVWLSPNSEAYGLYKDGKKQETAACVAAAFERAIKWEGQPSKPREHHEDLGLSPDDLLETFTQTHRIAKPWDPDLHVIPGQGLPGLGSLLTRLDLPTATVAAVEPVSPLTYESLRDLAAEMQLMFPNLRPRTRYKIPDLSGHRISELTTHKIPDLAIQTFRDVPGHRPMPFSVLDPFPFIIKPRPPQPADWIVDIERHSTGWPQASKLKTGEVIEEVRRVWAREDMLPPYPSLFVTGGNRAGKTLLMAEMVMNCLKATVKVRPTYRNRLREELTPLLAKLGSATGTRLHKKVVRLCRYYLRASQ